jgi:hypothetical protein
MFERIFSPCCTFVMPQLQLKILFYWISICCDNDLLWSEDDSFVQWWLYTSHQESISNWSEAWSFEELAKNYRSGKDHHWSILFLSSFCLSCKLGLININITVLPTIKISWKLSFLICFISICLPALKNKM